MFCPSCGAESPVELNYCNRCGANLNLPVAPAAVQINVTKPTLIIGLVMLFITLGGFAGVFSSAIDLSARTGSKDVPMAVIFFGMIGIVIIDALLFSLLWKLINAAISSAKGLTTSKPTYQQPQLAQPITSRLGPASVTENTTRFFDGHPQGSIPEPVAVKKND